uniref:Uncharacterized protein n=1 Tax=Oryza sativa subsp. japonica TaxID=39947 RepID=Q2QU16_ORYSJ|nr:hypothetical protein LOC_Os12g17810 [Oryza sativa Japonica Group]
MSGPSPTSSRRASPLNLPPSVAPKSDWTHHPLSFPLRIGAEFQVHTEELTQSASSPPSQPAGTPLSSPPRAAPPLELTAYRRSSSSFAVPSTVSDVLEEAVFAEEDWNGIFLDWRFDLYDWGWLFSYDWAYVTEEDFYSEGDAQDD